MPQDSNQARPLDMIDVSKDFKSTKGRATIRAVDRVSLHVGRNEMVCILGPSGCGKSTILSMAAGFSEPTSGTILGHSMPLRGPTSNRIMVFQSPVLYPWMTLEQNLLLIGESKDWVGDRRALRDTARQVIADVGLADFREHYPYQLSGGMRQRAQLARALVGSPELLLMDEPFGALDAQTRLTMQDMMQDVLAEYEQSALFITHDIQEALLLADRIYVMTGRPGRILEEIQLDWPRPRRARDIRGQLFDDLELRLNDLLHPDADAALREGA